MVEFPSVFIRLKDLCSSTVCEGQTKKLKIIIDFETNILEQLREVGVMKSYTIERTAGRVGNGCLFVFFFFDSAFCFQTSFSTVTYSNFLVLGIFADEKTGNSKVANDNDYSSSLDCKRGIACFKQMLNVNVGKCTR